MNIQFRDPSVPLSPRALELRRLVDKQVTSHPETLGMKDWEYDWDVNPHHRWRLDWNAHYCGTTRCISGWAQFFATGEVLPDPLPPTYDGEKSGIELLELTQDEYSGGHFARSLFYVSDQEAMERLRDLCYYEPGQEPS